MATRWQVCEDPDELQHRAVQIIESCARAAVAGNGGFHVVLAGGRTPEGVYEQLADLATRWTSWQIYFGDERCLPRGHPQRNDRMADRLWLDRVAIPPAQRHYIPAELGEAAVQSYARVLSGVARFDLVLLGLGEDGHTASLFTGHDLGCGPDAPAVLFVSDAPKPPPERITLSASRLSCSRRVLFLVSGASKRAAIRAWRSGVELPAAQISADDGVDVLVTADAC